MNLNSLRLQKYQHFQAHLQKKLNEEIGRMTRFFQDSLEDITEQMEPGGPKQVLNIALDVVRPYLQSLGLRVSLLTFKDIEVILPGKIFSQDSRQQMDEGAVVSAALFAYRKLWRKNSPRGGLHLEIIHFDFEKMRTLKGPIHLRCHLPAPLREAIYVELSDQKPASHETSVQLFDEQDQLLGKINIKAGLRLEKGLPWGSQKKFEVPGE